MRLQHLVWGSVFCLAANLCLAEDRVPGQLVVKLRGNAAEFRIQGLVIREVVKVLGDRAVTDFVPFQTDPSLNTVKLARDSDLSAAMAALQKYPQVEYVEPNYRYFPLSGAFSGDALFNDLPNDPDFQKSWGLNHFAGADIHVLPLWTRGFRGSRNVVVAVIDTGMDWEHPDLKANLYTNPGESGALGEDGQDNDGNGFVDDIHGWNFGKGTKDTTDSIKHGTHCAGIIGAVGNNGIGTAGVNWEVSILPIKFIDGWMSGTLQGAVDSINYARRMKARVINASWGGRASSKVLSDAIEVAAGEGILFVAASGNNGQNSDLDPVFPASYPLPNVVSVAATDEKDELGSFSNYGFGAVHVAAPGVKIWSTVPGGQYEEMDGTSMAAPHVAGIAALLLAAQPELTAAQIKERLIRTSDPLPGLRKKLMAEGRVNAYQAFFDITPVPLWTGDPQESDWQSVPKIVETIHPYEDKMNRVYPIRVPGAKYIRVHFEKIDVEERFDYVMLETALGKGLQRFAGLRQDVTSLYVEGDSLQVRLRSNYSDTAWGFKIDRVEVVYPPARSSLLLGESRSEYP